MKGIFEFVIGRRAFVDRIDLSLNRPVSLVSIKHCRVVRDKPCLGPKSFYARHMIGLSCVSGNPIHLWYGKVSRFPRACRTADPALGTQSVNSS